MPQLLVHIAHEVMKMAAPAFWQRQAVIEQVHQHGLAATDAPVRVYAARAATRRAAPRHPQYQPLPEAARVALQQTRAQRLEALERRALCGLGIVAASGQLARVALVQRGPRAVRALRHRDSVRQWRSPRGPQDPARPEPRARPRARYRVRPPGDRAPRSGSPGVAPAAPRARPARSTPGAAEHAPGAGRRACRESPPG